MNHFERSLRLFVLLGILSVVALSPSLATAQQSVATNKTGWDSCLVPDFRVSPKFAGELKGNFLLTSQSPVYYSPTFNTDGSVNLHFSHQLRDNEYMIISLEYHNGEKDKWEPESVRIIEGRTLEDWESPHCFGDSLPASHEGIHRVVLSTTSEYEGSTYQIIYTTH